jgi:hypothetical protein
VEGTDFHAVVNRRIAITPIHLDLTGRRLLRRLRTWSWELPPGPGPAGAAAAEPPGPDEPVRRDRDKRLVEEERRERR